MATPKVKMVALILGGGQGKRLYPLTKDRSKPAVPVAGKYRLIDIPISNCLNSGVKRIFVATQFNSASLNRHIKNTYHFDPFSHGFVDILAAEQTPHSKDWYQGTSDAVKQSMHHVLNQDFDYILILSGDQLYQLDFEHMVQHHIEKKASLTIGTKPVSGQAATELGIMKTGQRGRIKAFREKPSVDELYKWESDTNHEGMPFLASMGIYIFNRQTLLDLFEQNPLATDFGKEIIPAAIKNYRSVSYTFDGYWQDIGSISSFFDANLALTHLLPDFNLFDNKRPIYTRARSLAPAKVFGTRLVYSLITDGCIVHAESITHSVIGLRSRIGDQCVLRDCVVMGNDFYESIRDWVDGDTQIHMGIGERCYIERAIIDKNSRIGHDVRIVGKEGLPNIEHADYCIVDGIVVVKKGATIPHGAQIGAV